jgi:hypothetical protein
VENGHRTISDSEELKVHITQFYKNLFGSEPDPVVHLNEEFWSDGDRVSVEDNVALTQPFSGEEIEFAIKDMKTNTAPGPDEFPVSFYKEFLSEVKPFMKEMLDDLVKGQMDLSRINYGVIILLPKIIGASDIRQYMPNCLINVIFKVITKILTIRVSKIIHKYIEPTQITFIPGRNIHDGW